MEWLLQSAHVTCDHVMGRVGLQAGQRLVHVGGVPVLTEPDAEGRPIAGCPNIGPTIKPCTTTLKQTQGLSAFVRIAGRAVCLRPTTGLTDGTPPGMVKYRVRDPGQAHVRALG